jgi:hypothetical protein
VENSWKLNVNRNQNERTIFERSLTWNEWASYGIKIPEKSEKHRMLTQQFIQLNH